MAADESLFDEWASLNKIIAPWRSRFDYLREHLWECGTEEEIRDMIAAEGFLSRYPTLPRVTCRGR